MCLVHAWHKSFDGMYTTKNRFESVLPTHCDTDNLLDCRTINAFDRGLVRTSASLRTLALQSKPLVLVRTLGMLVNHEIGCTMGTVAFDTANAPTVCVHKESSPGPNKKNPNRVVTLPRAGLHAPSTRGGTPSTIYSEEEEREEEGRQEERILTSLERQKSCR